MPPTGPPPPPPPPPLIGDRYVPGALLGKGAFGEVYAADVKGVPGRRVAVKLLRRPDLDADDFEARLVREVKNASRLNHPNAVRVYEWGALPDGRLWYAMELCAGRSLGKIMGEEGRLAPPRAVRLSVETLAALGAAHDLGMVHRDVKPENIQVVLLPDGRETAKLLDFGLAKVTRGGGASQQVTQHGLISGTLPYMSREQLLGEPLDGRADVYAIAATLFEALAGRRPFTAQTENGLIHAILGSAPPDLGALRGGAVSAALTRAIERGLAKEKAARWPTAAAFAAALLEAEPGARSFDSDLLAVACSSVAQDARSPMAGAASAPVPATKDSPARAIPPTRVRGPAPVEGDFVALDDPSLAVVNSTPTTLRRRGGTGPIDIEARSFDGSLPLGGRYVLRRAHAESKRGTLFEAVDLDSGEAVAVKVLRGRGAIADADWRRYLRGVKNLCGVTHPHVVQLRDAGLTSKGAPFFVLEWVPGAPLARFLGRGGVPLPEAAGATCQILEGLDAAHAAGLVHRDVTPSHVLVVPTDAGAVVKLFGFGLAKSVLGEDGTVTRWGEPLGTARYMAPEQLLGRPLDARADVYSAAVVLFEMIAGRTPIVSDDPITVARAVLGGPPLALPPEVPAAVRERLGPVLGRALARERDARFPDAAAFREALLPLAGWFAFGDFEALGVQPPPPALPRSVAEGVRS